MIERRAQKGNEESRAYYSGCGAYRYGLWRCWDAGRPVLLYVMLNPSTATEARNDPTIERCQRRAVALGFGEMRIANLFSFRATHPSDLRAASDPVGPETAALLEAWGRAADMTLAAWGVHGAWRGRGAGVAPLLAGDVRHLGLTRDGHPRHPLYVPYARRPEPWPVAARYAPASGAR